MAAVEETETFDELLFPWLDFFFSLDQSSAKQLTSLWSREKKSNLGKRSSSLVSFLYRPINVLETEYKFQVSQNFSKSEEIFFQVYGKIVFPETWKTFVTL